MSQNTGNAPMDNQGNSGRGSNESGGRKGYEGFEGMNYEQRRQPFRPQQASNNNGDEYETDSEDSRRHGEM